jgi:hypothetical protein
MGAVCGGQGWKQVRGNPLLPVQDKRLYSLTRLSPKFRRPSKLAVLAVGGTLVLAGAGTAAAVTLQSPPASLSAAATGLDADSLHSSSGSSTAAKAAASISAAAADKTAAEKAQAAAQAAAEKAHTEHVAHTQHTALLTAEARAAAQQAAAAKAAAQQAAAQAAATRQAQTASDTSSSSGSSSSSRSSSGSTPSGSPQEIAQQLLAQAGESGQWSCLDQLWQQESGWSITAENASSGAYGIPQALPGSKMAADGPDWQTDATTQIKWGLSYIASTYGSPCAAWDHEQADGWY